MGKAEQKYSRVHKKHADYLVEEEREEADIHR